MPPTFLVDLATIDFSKVEVPLENIRLMNPQRFEMEQLSGIYKVDFNSGTLVGFRDLRPDEFWAKGHIPGRPLFPGVLMIEAAAQLSSYYCKAIMPPDKQDQFIGFGGVENVKFRGTVLPGDRLLLLGKAMDMRPRRAIFSTQGVVKDRLVFEATIIGMPV